MPRVKDGYYDNLAKINSRTDKVLLNKAEACRVLEIDRKTLDKRYPFPRGEKYVSVAWLARAIS